MFNKVAKAVNLGYRRLPAVETHSVQTSLRESRVEIDVNSVLSFIDQCDEHDDYEVFHHLISKRPKLLSSITPSNASLIRFGEPTTVEVAAEPVNGVRLSTCTSSFLEDHEEASQPLLIRDKSVASTASAGRMLRANTVDASGQEMVSQVMRTSSNAAEIRVLDQVGLCSSKSKFPLPNESASIGPGEAIRSVFAHLRFDGDGGLLNLNKHTGQLPKGHLIITFSKWRACLFTILVLRIAVNVPATFAVSAYAIALSLNPEAQKDVIHDMYSSRCILPMKDLFFAIAVIEMCRSGYAIFVFFADILEFFCTEDDNPNYTEETLSSEVNPRYLSLSNVVWDDLLLLQTFSSLQCLSYANPSVLSHEMRNLTARDEAAIALFEHMFGFAEHTISETAVHAMAVRLLINSQRKSGIDEATLQEHAHQYLDSTPYDIFEKILGLENDLRNPEVTDETKDHRFDASILYKFSWHVQAVYWLELFTFWFSCTALAFVGFLAFMVKSARWATVLLDPDETTFHVCFTMVAAINQVIGIISVQRLLRSRIMRFCFGGRDNVVSASEVTLMNTYQALLAEAVWKHPIEGARFPQAWRLISLVTLNDDDIQRLVLEETSREKHFLIEEVRKMADRNRFHNLLSQVRVRFQNKCRGIINPLK